MQIDRKQIWPAVRFTLTHVGSAALIITFLAVLAKPHAEDFVEGAVDDRIQKLERQMGDVQRSMREQRQSQAVMSNEIENLSKNQDETRANTRMILQSLQGMRRELRGD